MKPFHQWLGDLSEALSHTYKNNSAVPDIEPEKEVKLDSITELRLNIPMNQPGPSVPGIQSLNFFPLSLSRAEQAASATYLFLGMPQNNNQAKNFVRVLADFIDINRVFGFNQTYRSEADRALKNFEILIKPYIKINLV